MQRDDSRDEGGHGEQVHRDEEVEDVPRPRLVGRARRRVHEPVDGDPAVLRLPDEVRHDDNGRDRCGQEHAPRPQEVAAPHRHGRDEEDDRDRERVLRLEPDADGNAQCDPRPASEQQPEDEPQNDNGCERVERDRLEEPVRGEQDGLEADTDRSEHLGAPSPAEVARDEGGDDDRDSASEHGEDAEADERPAEEQARQRREQRRHWWDSTYPPCRCRPATA